jgi:hypothetical protein
MSEHPHSHHRSQSRRHRHREGRRPASDASNGSRSKGASHARSSSRHQRHSRGGLGSRLLRRLARNPLIPLVVIAAIIAFAMVRSDLEETPEAEKMQMHPIHEGFSDAKGALQALQLMDARQFVDAAQAIQGLNMPPIRLSALMESVRADSPAARQTLITLVCTWILEQDSELKGVSFPSKDTPTPVLDFIASFEQYRRSPGAIATPQTNSGELAALFKRVSLEKQLRATEQPRLAPPDATIRAPGAGRTPPVSPAQAPPDSTRKPPSPADTPTAPKTNTPAPAYVPPVEAP